ncbi:MAG TPA: alpha-2-macroglobulin family protein, partial [Methylomirabilota bacterium]|nr:alpha-2-macroglobulin family protein [Methylomirabilota bacterium]
VTLRDANHEEVAQTVVTTNGFGSASGSFELPPGRLLGSWNLQTSLGGGAGVRVEEYKRPTFEVTVSDPPDALRLNREARLQGEVRYYFGLPVVTGDVRWRVTREPVYPWWWFWWNPSPAADAQVVASGEGGLDEEGRFQVVFTPAADEREAADGVSYRFRLSVDVTDPGGETRSAERTFRLGFVAVEAAIRSDLGFLAEGEPATLTVVRTDLDGAPRAGAGAWRLVALEQPAETPLPADLPIPVSPEAEPFASPGDRLRPRWQTDSDPRRVLAGWPEGRELAAGTLRHGDDGLAEIDLPGLEPGAYRVLYTTEDPFGATFDTAEQLIVAGDRRTPLALPAVLRFERSSVEVGGTARLLVHTGLTAQEMVLEIYRDGHRIERRDLGPGRSGVVELPVAMADRGGFGVTLRLLRDFQLVEQTATVMVPWTDRELEVDFATFRDRLRPGTSETFRVTVRGADQALVETASAELLAYMYDRSLDIFAPHNPPGVASLYPTRTAVDHARASLGQAGTVWSSGRDFVRVPSFPHLRGDQLRWISGYGIGGPGRRGPLYRSKMAMAEGGEVMAMAAPQAADRAMADEVGEADALEMRQGMPREETVATGGAGAAEEPPMELRSDFAETAFWRPHLLLDDDGAAVIEFQVPDSVTEWNVWVHALTRDLRGGSAHRTTRSVKELMVRPYLPRFLREGDRAELKVVVNNAGEEALAGILDFEVFDPDTEEDLRPLFGLSAEQTTGVAFTVEPGGGVDLGFPVTVPPRVGPVAFKVTARAGDFSDGELRSLPVLPGRMHLAQSRFVTLRDADRRELHFADMAAGDDPSLIHNQLVVSVDAQLFYSVLNALPYLVEYPYECTEQTLNRFLSTGIVASVFDSHPAVAEMAAKLAERDVRTEPWDAGDPNRKMALEETPWLQTSRGGEDDPSTLIKILDPRVARAQRDAALAELVKAQTSVGAFPWMPGGPPSPYMTLYILYGFSKGLEFGVEAPKDVVQRAWAYMHRHWVDEIVDEMLRRDCCWELVTFLNFVLSSYPDDSWTGGVFTADDRADMLEHGFRHWREHSPLLKGYLALTLERAGRHEDAVLVWDSVMDSAKTERDLGTYWAPEDRAWLWYNDTIETHAFALRVLGELEPDDERRHGLVQWLFLNKKLNHWKSTRSTAEVISSLVHYLKREDTLGTREAITVEVGPRTREFVFSPDEYTGARNRIVVPGPEVEAETMSTVVVEKETPGFAFASATWHFSTERLPEEARGDLFSVTREYFRRFNDGDRWVLRPLADGERLSPGDQVEVRLSIRAKHAAEYVHLRDPRGAGFEPETLHSQYKWDLGIGWYEEVRDSGTNFFFEWLPAGEYSFKYRLRANMAGSFKVGPATLQSMYAPEFTAYSAGHRLEVAGE